MAKITFHRNPSKDIRVQFGLQAQANLEGKSVEVSQEAAEYLSGTKARGLASLVPGEEKKQQPEPVPVVTGAAPAADIKAAESAKPKSK